MARGRKKLAHLLREAGHSRRYLRDWLPFWFLTSLCPMKEPGIQTPRRWLFWDISLPSSQLAGFLNKVLFLASTLVSDSLPCHAGGGSELGLSHNSWGAYQRNDFSEPQTLESSHTQKRAKFLALGYLVLPFVAKLLYNPAPPLLLGAVLSGSHEMLPPGLEVLQYSHRIKQLSTFRWHIFFLSQQYQQC